VIREDEYERSLDRLACVLGTGKFSTARALAEKFSCSKVVIYKRIRALQSRGYAFAICYVHEGSTGPLSTAYAFESVDQCAEVKRR